MMNHGTLDIGNSIAGSPRVEFVEAIALEARIPARGQRGQATEAIALEVKMPARASRSEVGIANQILIPRHPRVGLATQRTCPFTTTVNRYWST
jgi:hypothetical protein